MSMNKYTALLMKLTDHTLMEIAYTHIDIINHSLCIVNDTERPQMGALHCSPFMPGFQSMAGSSSPVPDGNAGPGREGSEAVRGGTGIELDLDRRAIIKSSKLGGSVPIE